MDVFNFLYLFDSREEAFKVLDGETGQEIFKGLEKQGIETYGTFDLGFRSMTNSSRPIVHPEDAKGKTLEDLQKEIEEEEMERGFKIMVDQAVANGAAGISILQPMFLKPNFNELFLHFKTIAEAVPEIPVLLYNNPGRVGYTLSADLVEKLAHEVKNIVGMKDTSGDITQTEEFIRRNADVGFKVFGGKDTLLYASLCIGAVGGVCTAGNFMPELIVDIYNKYVAGDLKGSLAAQYKLNPVRLAMDGASFPVAAKDMAIMRGQAAGKPYLPNLPTPEGASYDKMKKEMEKAGLI